MASAAEQAAARPKLFVGLGNPAARYRDTRHNTGRRFLELLSARHRGEFQQPRVGVPGELAGVHLEEISLRLFRPATFMNESGRALAAALRVLRLRPEHLLVAHDDIDLPPGVVRLKRSGGHGGHNGLRDVLARIGGDFPRLRFGVGRPGNKEEVIDYVLRRPEVEEARLIDEALRAALDCFPDLARGDLEGTARRLHSRPRPPAPSANSFPGMEPGT